jgi:hypothetical protein
MPSTSVGRGSGQPLQEKTKEPLFGVKLEDLKKIHQQPNRVRYVRRLALPEPG